jgi:hypothetical protein
MTWLGMSPLLGQSFHPFGVDGDWSSVSTANFDVLYQPGQEESAIVTARLAEVARYELGQMLDFRPEAHFVLIYTSEAQEVLYSTLSLAPDPERSGVFQLPDRYAVVVHPGSSQGWEHAVRRQVARLMLREFTFDEHLGTTLQKRMLLYEAPWLYEGLIEYMSSGWTYEDEMWLQHLDKDQLLPLALEGDQAINRVVRKSIWHFISHEYGEQKIPEVTYLVNISNSIESGIISVLGLTLNTLTARWEQYLTARLSTQKSRRTDLTRLEAAKMLPEMKKETLVSFAYNEATNRYALCLNRRGKLSVYLYNPESKAYSSTPIRSGFQSDNAPFLDFDMPLAFSRDGEVLATVVYQKQRWYLAYYEPASGELDLRALPRDIDRVNSLAWSGDHSQLALSAWHHGQADIFTTESGSAKLLALTDDVYDDLDPTWSFDDQFLFFSSNREGEDAKETPGRYQSMSRTFDLYKFDRTAGGNALIRLTNTPTINERQPFAPNSFELRYLSDASGIFNLSTINIFSKKTQPLSDLAAGVTQFQTTENQVFLATPVNGHLRVFHLPAKALYTSQAPEPTLLRLDQLAEREKMSQRPPVQPARVDQSEPEEEEEAEMTAPMGSDVVKERQKKQQEEAASKSPVRYYIFDEEDEPYEVRTPEGPPSSQPQARPATPTGRNTVLTTVFGQKPKPNPEEVAVGRSKAAGNRWAADYFGLNLQYDPLAGYGLEFQFGYQDLLNHHRVDLNVRPYFNLRNAESSLRYTYLKPRIDLYGEIGFMNRHYQRELPFQTDTIIFGYQQYRLRGGAVYPINSMLALEGNLDLYYLRRVDKGVRRLGSLYDDSAPLASAGLRLTFDNTESREGYTYKGFAGMIGGASYYDVAQGDFAFHRIDANARYYKDLGGRVVLATQLSGAFNLPKDRQQYYLGGVDKQLLPPIGLDNQSENSVPANAIDTALTNFHFLNFLMPMRGFRPITREGSRYVVANIELRVPLSRLAKGSLPSKSLYNLQLIPFLDAGTVWINGNPFSQKKPTDTRVLSNGAVTVELQTLKSPFLIGFGSGLQLDLLGWTIRSDLSWGLEDNTLQKPILLTSVGRSF